MSNTLFITWVKNVYSLRIDSALNRGNSYVSYTSPIFPTQQVGVQLPIFTQVSTMFSAILSTVKMSIQPLLISQLYPLSTVPTIKRTKE